MFTSHCCVIILRGGIFSGEVLLPYVLIIVHAFSLKIAFEYGSNICFEHVADQNLIEKRQ